MPVTSKTRAAERMLDIPFSDIRRVIRRAAEHERAGKAVIHLEIGRPDFDTPQHIKEAAKAALDRGFVHYTPNDGIPALRQAIAERLARCNGLRVDPDGEIIVTIGTVEAVFVALAAFLNPGDEALVPVPAWPNYFHALRLVGAHPVPVPLRAEDRFRLDPGALERAITPRTRMLIVNSPHNPTGAVLDEAQRRTVADVAIRHDLLVLSDEIYDTILYEGHRPVSLATLPGMAERTITVNGFSKAYSMTGWRIGYVAAARELSDAMIRVHQYCATSATSFAQYGAVAAYAGPQAPCAAMVAEFDRRRRVLLGGLAEIDGLAVVPPQGAFYVFPSVEALGLSSAEFADYLLDEFHVAVVPGGSFGAAGEGFVRLAYSSAYESLVEAVARMQEACRRLARTGRVRSGA